MVLPKELVYEHNDRPTVFPAGPAPVAEFMYKIADWKAGIGVKERIAIHE